MLKLLQFSGLLVLAAHADAANIGVVGLFPGKAVIVIDNKVPRTYSVGDTVYGNIKLVAVNGSSAVFEENGKRKTLNIGDHATQTATKGPASVTLQADSRGHFIAKGQINGITVRMLVDTGATLIALPASEALRLGIDYRKGQVGHANTANGMVQIYRVTLDTVKIGDVELNQIDAVVQEQGLPFVLLGMSFLKRTEMRREGEQMTLIKRF